jgi:hypothetical protein
LNERPDISDVEAPGIDISYQLPLDDGSGRVVVFRSLVPQACSDDEFNAVLDKFSRAAERQKALAVLPSYANQLEDKKELLFKENAALFEAVQERDAQAAIWQRQSSESGRRNWKPSPAQSADHVKIQARIAQHEQHIRVLEKEIASETKRLAIYKGRLGQGE